MKKTILYLINGFGIEQKDSFNIYKSDLMPNLDELTKTSLFSSLETSDYNLQDAYRTFSVESKEAVTYTFLDKYTLLLKENPNFVTFTSSIKDNSKVHLFCFLENYKSIDHIKNIVALINKNIILHLVLTSENTSDYLELERIIAKMMLELKSCSIGSIVGKNTMINSSKDYVSMLNNGVGEKWHEVAKKLNVLATSKTLPINAKEFFVNENFTIAKEDSILMLNYDYFNLTNFLENLKTIYPEKVYSMFPIDGIKYPLYMFPSSSISLINGLKSIGAKGLVVADGSNFGYINYFANGLNRSNDPSLLFMKTDNDILYNKDIMTKVLKDEQFNLIIINQTIDDCLTIPDLNNRLKRIDESVGIIKDICVENKITFILSSLYGVKKELLEDQYIKRLVNFSTKVPFIVLDDVYKKNSYSLSYGDIIGIKNTCLKLINPSYIGSGLIKKKDFLSKLLKK